MLNIVLISQIIIRMRSMISRSCLFLSVTASVSSRFSCNSFLYSSVCTGSGLLSASSLNGSKLSMFVCSIPDVQKKQVDKNQIGFRIEKKKKKQFFKINQRPTSLSTHTHTNHHQISHVRCKYYLPN